MSSSWTLAEQALVERRARRGDLGQEAAGAGDVARPHGGEGRLVEAEGPALLGQADLGDQVVGLGLDAELAGLGLLGHLLGRGVVAAGERAWACSAVALRD